MTGCNPYDLAELLALLADEASDPQLFSRRNFSGSPRPTLRELGRERGVSGEWVRRILTDDAALLREALRTRRYERVRLAAERMGQEFGALVAADSPAVERWRARVGSPSYEILLWVAEYEYRGEWVALSGAQGGNPQRVLEKAIGTEWLVRAEDLSDSTNGQIRADSFQLMLEASRRWRHIGEGWFLRFDCVLEERMRRVLLLVGHPMFAEDLARAVGHKQARTVKDNRGSVVRIDKDFRMALPEWGYPEYRGIVASIDERIDRAGGEASVPEMVAEIAERFGVQRASVAAYLQAGPYEVTGDKAKRVPIPEHIQRDVSNRECAVPIGKHWGQRVTVTEAHMRGYSFALDRDIAALNGVRPQDSLRVPVTGLPSANGTAEASVIWRVVSISRAVEVGRLRKVLVENGIKEGDEIVIVPTPESCTVLDASSVAYW